MKTCALGSSIPVTACLVLVAFLCAAIGSPHASGAEGLNILVKPGQTLFFQQDSRGEETGFLAEPGSRVGRLPSRWRLTNLEFRSPFETQPEMLAPDQGPQSHAGVWLRKKNLCFGLEYRPRERVGISFLAGYAFGRSVFEAGAGRGFNTHFPKNDTGAFGALALKIRF